jgi:hypothetical protein
MPFSDAFSVGKDNTIDFIDPLTGTLRSFAIIVSVQIKPENKKISSNAMDGTNRFAYLPQGGTINITFDRGSGDLDRFAADLEAAYYAGGTIPQSQITQTIKELDGSISQFRFEGVAVNVNDLGTWKGDDKVNPTLEAAYGRRVKVA